MILNLDSKDMLKLRLWRRLKSHVVHFFIFALCGTTVMWTRGSDLLIPVFVPNLLTWDWTCASSLNCDSTQMASK